MLNTDVESRSTTTIETVYSRLLLLTADKVAGQQILPRKQMTVPLVAKFAFAGILVISLASRISINR